MLTIDKSNYIYWLYHIVHTQSSGFGSVQQVQKALAGVPARLSCLATYSARLLLSGCFVRISVEIKQEKISLKQVHDCGLIWPAVVFYSEYCCQWYVADGKTAGCANIGVISQVAGDMSGTVSSYCFHHHNLLFFNDKCMFCQQQRHKSDSMWFNSCIISK